MRGTTVVATLCAMIMMCVAGPCAPAGAQTDEIRATVERFVTAQNAHDLAAVSELLVDAPDSLWITRGTAIWGRSAALERFATLYKGTWRLDPAMSELKIISLGERVAQVYMPIVFTIGAAGQAPQQTRFLMNQILLKTPQGWKVSSILPIPAPTP